MAWRDRLRRRAAEPDIAGPGSPGATGTPGPSATGGSGPSAGGAPGSVVPGDWDGGWRRTAAPELTVSRAPLGVSDGLAFRAGLAAWQNPSFDAGLGHALLPTAPTGLVSGVTRPAAAPRHTHSAGVRCCSGHCVRRGRTGRGGRGHGGRADNPGLTQDTSGRTAIRPGTPRAAIRSGTPGERSGGNSTAGKDRSGDAGRARGLTSAHSPAVLSSSPSAARQAARPGAGPVVTPAAPATPLVRRVAVVPPAAADGSMARPAARTRPAPAEPSRPAAGSGAVRRAVRLPDRPSNAPRRGHSPPGSQAAGGIPCRRLRRVPPGRPAPPGGARADRRPAPRRTRAQGPRPAARRRTGARQHHHP